jgi:thiol-disulfide isomerase/thioredoxin
MLFALLGLSLVALYHRSELQAWATNTSPGKIAGQLAPQLPDGITDLDGRAFRLPDLRGQVVLLHFWTFACGNCEHMLPSYAAWDARYRTRGLRVVGVHTPELPREHSIPALREQVKKKNIEWTVVPDGEEEIWTAFGVHAWPTVFVIDRDGKIRGSFVGDDRSADIEALIERTLGDGH